MNSNEACHHGRKVGGSYFALYQWNVLEDNNTFYYKNNMVVLQEVGLPSQVARFSKVSAYTLVLKVIYLVIITD